MTVTHSTLGILSAVALCTLAGCGGDAVSPLLFAQRDGEEPFAAVETAVDTSPSGKFAVEYAWDDPDTHGNYQLTRRCVTDGRTVLLGRGTRGAVAKWRKSQIGDLRSSNIRKIRIFPGCLYCSRVSMREKAPRIVVYCIPRRSFSRPDLRLNMRG